MSIAGESARNHVVESLLGKTGEPQQVMASANALGQRVRGAMLSEINDRLAFSLDMELKSAKVTRFADALPKDASHMAICIAPSASSSDALTIMIDADAIALLVSAAFGGDPDISVAPIERDLSDIELSLLGDFFEAIAKSFEGSGERALGITFPLGDIITGSEIPRMPRRDGPAAILEFRIHSPLASGVISVLMPQRVLLTHRGDAMAESDSPLVASKWRARFSEEVMRSNVNLEATVPMSKFTLGEIAKWRVGQVIEMPDNAQAQTQLSARRKTIFVCEFGKLGNHFTVRVGQPFDAGKDFLDRLVSK
ncbi:MAG: FliM/FliN family flagellar motor switch protein [Rhizobiaceae bacterium]